MRKRTHKGLLGVLAFVLCLCLLPVGALAADSNSDFTIQDGVLTKYTYFGKAAS